MSRILVVEDDRAIARGIECILKNQGLQVDLAFDGGSGLQSAIEQHFDLIVLDIMLPSMNGFEICEKLRQQGVHSAILMLTSLGDETNKLAGFRAGADDYVTKPFSLAELNARVHALLRRTEFLASGIPHKPLQQNRIFMFLDLKSSTTIAELLGHIRYYHFLNDFFNDTAQPILNNQGEVYQYIGDEITISWPLNRLAKKAYCIQCFFDISDAIWDRSQYYRDTYAMIPTFKAAVHCGVVTAGVIEGAKKELVYTGDVLNTAARMQELCNTYGEYLIISGDLCQHIVIPADLQLKKLGTVVLRGKSVKPLLYAVNKTHARQPLGGY